MTPLNPYPDSILSVVSQPQVTFSTLPEKKLTACEIKSIPDNASQNNQCKESLENRGCDSGTKTSQLLTGQDIEGVTTSVSQPLINKCEAELVGFIQACDDAEVAKHIQKILAECCSNGTAERTKIWGKLTGAEQCKFKALLT